MTHKSAVLVDPVVELGRTGNQQSEAGHPPSYAIGTLGKAHEVNMLAPSVAERATEVLLPDQSERGTTMKASLPFHWTTLRVVRYGPLAQWASQ